MCIDIAYIDKLAKMNGVKYLLVLQDLLDKTVDAEGMKTIASKQLFRAFFIMIAENNRTKKNESKREHYLLENIEKYAQLKKCKFTLQ